MTCRLPDESVHLAQAQSSAEARLFGRKERFKSFFNQILSHADAFIGYRNQHILTGDNTFVLPAITLIQKSIAGFDSDLAAVRHGIASVYCEVDDGSFEFGRINFGKPKPGAADSLKLYLFAKRAK